MLQHKILQNKDGITDAIQLEEGKHKGIIFTYGKVELKPDDNEDKLVVKFEYDIHKDLTFNYDKGALEEELGDLLLDLLQESAEKNQITYTGGIDETREDDLIESDKQ